MGYASIYMPNEILIKKYGDLMKYTGFFRSLSETIRRVDGNIS